jgi:polysaccharide biosynthesis transport protein
MELSYLLHALLKRKWIILGATGLTVLVALILLLSRNKMYESAAQYSTGFTIQQVSLVNEVFNGYETDTKFNNVLETFHSPKVIGMLSYDLMLHDLEHPTYPFKRLTDRKLKSDAYGYVNRDKAKIILKGKIDSLQLLGTAVPEERDMLDFIDLYDYDYYSIEKNLYIERIPHTDYLDIIFKSENPDLSAYVVNRIGAEFLKFYNSLTSILSEESVQKISNIVDQKKKQVDSITENLRKEKASQGPLDPAEASKNAMQTVSTLQSKLADEKGVYSKAYHQLQSVKNQLAIIESTPTATPGLSNNQEIVRIRTKIRELAPNKNDPKVADQITKLREDLNKQESSLNTGAFSHPSESLHNDLISKKSDLEAEMEASDQTIAYLTSQINRYSAQNNAGAGNDVKIDALRTEVDIATKEYSDIKSKFMQAEGFKQTPTINFRQTLVGQPALDPVPSHLLLYVGISGISMFAFSSLIIILLELLDSSIKSPSRFMHLVDLALLNPVNRINSKGKELQKMFNSSKTLINPSADEELFVNFLRKLRFDIENSGKKIFLITSTKKSEGKTTLVTALAYSLSMTNKRVLIIDANFSNNELTRNFEVNGSLEHFYLPPQGFSFSSFKDNILPSNSKYVDIIGCKGGNYTPDEILDKNNLLEHLKKITDYYSYILLEGAALNDNSDSKELSRYVDGIIAVFSADSTINESDRESIRFLLTTKEKFIGSVLNKVENENIDL